MNTRRTNLTFTDPYSRHEILLLDDPSEDGVLGLIYHPQVITPPIPWRSCCPHCATGKHSKLKLHLRREIQMLCTHESRDDIIRYRVPSYSLPYSLLVKTDEHGWCIRVARPGIENTLDVIQRPGEKTVFSGNPRAFQSTILHRCIKFLLSSRETPRHEITSCLTALIAQQTAEKRKKIPVRKRSCNKIDWSSVRFNLPEINTSR